jgi:hypothetical protein
MHWSKNHYKCLTRTKTVSLRLGRILCARFVGVSGMPIYKVMLCVSVLVFVCGLLQWPVYTFPISSFGNNGYWHPPIVGSNLLMLSVFVVPFLSLVSVILNWRAKYILLGASAVIFSLFGVIPIPFIEHFYTKNYELNSMLIYGINLFFLGFIIYLYIAEKKTTNKFKNTVPSARTRNSARPF